MAQYQWQTGDLITAARLNANGYNLFSGVAGSEAPITLADNVAGTLLLKPTSDPAASTALFAVQNAAGVTQFSVAADGTIYSLTTPFSQLFQDQIISVPAHQVTFSAIPVGFRTLVLQIAAASDDVALYNTPIAIRVNGVSTSVYTAQQTIALGGSIGTNSLATTTSQPIGTMNSSRNLTDGIGALTLTIPGANLSPVERFMNSQSSCAADTHIGIRMDTIGIAYFGAAAPISQIDLYAGTPGGALNFIVGSTLTLYGFNG